MINNKMDGFTCSSNECTIKIKLDHQGESLSMWMLGIKKGLIAHNQFTRPESYRIVQAMVSQWYSMEVKFGLWKNKIIDTFEHWC